MTEDVDLSKAKSPLDSPSWGIFDGLRSALWPDAGLATWLIRIFTAVVPLAFLLVVSFQPWVEPKWMFLDPLTAAELSGDCCHTYYGFVSTLGLMLWALTSAICLFAAVLLLHRGASGAMLRFSISAGVLTGWLGLDDAFLVHETVLPSFGVPQNAVLAFYVSLAVAYVISNWRLLLSFDFWLLMMGGGALAASVLIDTVFHSLNPALVLLEDGAKFFGVCCWASFHVTTLARVLMHDDANNKSAIVDSNV